jgi:hypothetical protein
MKRKPSPSELPKPRNFVMLALSKRTGSGVHRKSNKALRRANNQTPLGV